MPPTVPRLCCNRLFHPLFFEFCLGACELARLDSYSHGIRVGFSLHAMHWQNPFGMAVWHVAKECGLLLGPSSLALRTGCSF
jgi:hypothetical protein